jgi:hypothetical protein
LFQPLDNLLARPVMIVVQMQDDRIEGKTFVASDRTAPPHVLEAIEQPIETRADGVRFVRIARQRIGAFIGGAKRRNIRRTPAPAAAWRLPRWLRRARSDRRGELDA